MTKKYLCLMVLIGLVASGYPSHNLQLISMTGTRLLLNLNGSDKTNLPFTYDMATGEICQVEATGPILRILSGSTPQTIGYKVSAAPRPLIEAVGVPEGKTVQLRTSPNPPLDRAAILALVPYSPWALGVVRNTENGGAWCYALWSVEDAGSYEVPGGTQQEVQPPIRISPPLGAMSTAYSEWEPVAWFPSRVSPPLGPAGDLIAVASQEPANPQSLCPSREGRLSLWRLSDLTCIGHVVLPDVPSEIGSSADGTEVYAIYMDTEERPRVHVATFTADQEMRMTSRTTYPGGRMKDTGGRQRWSCGVGQAKYAGGRLIWSADSSESITIAPATAPQGILESLMQIVGVNCGQLIANDDGSLLAYRDGPLSFTVWDIAGSDPTQLATLNVSVSNGRIVVSEE